MQTPAAWETLKQFRLAAYRTLGLRKDSLFELMEAVLAAPGPATIVRLSLAAVFRRAWPSAPDALADGVWTQTAVVSWCRPARSSLRRVGVRSGHWTARSGPGQRRG